MKPILTTLSYSGGAQSHALLEMVLRGDIQKPDHFLVLHADPGMEDFRTYKFVSESKRRCKAAGIEFVSAEGPNLFSDLITFAQRELSRLDLPPYYTKNRETGTKGRLKQGCTQFYKIAPIRRELRRFLFSRFGIPISSKRVPVVETWIGFASDEASRIKPSNAKYVQYRYPLIELGMDRLKVDGYYLKNGIEKPPRSVCAACFANGLSYFEDMYWNRPDDWEKAVAVDEAVRDMRQLGVKDEVYVSSSLVPLKELPKINFKKQDGDYLDHRCNSGVCFL